MPYFELFVSSVLARLIALHARTCWQQFVGLVNNAKENEPFFMGIATAIAVAGNPPTWGASALYLYCGARLGHAVLFLYDFPESILPYQVLVRATPYLVGVFTMFRLAASRFS